METKVTVVVPAKKGVVNQMLRLIDYSRQQIYVARTKRHELQSKEDKEIEFIWTQLNIGIEEDVVMSKVQFVKRKTQANEN